MKTLVCVDRDGTINVDDNYYLGISPDWKRQVEFLPRVIRGMRLLNTLPDTHIFIVTNQAGVAIDELRFAALTEERMHEVNRYIIAQLEERGAHVRGYFACPFVDNKYVEKATKRGWRIHQSYVKDGHPDLKPNIGMLEKAAQSIGVTLDQVNLYVIGDRASDVQLGLNGRGTGILVPGPKTIEEGDPERVRALRASNPKKIYIASNFYDAATYIQRNKS